MQTLGFRRPNQVREAVYRHLKDLLLSGRFSPGERLSEPLLAQELGVSRTPVREALMRLAEEGLVELVPGKGARVRVFAPEEVEEVYGVRALLEGEAAREAALRATPWELAELERLRRDHFVRFSVATLEFLKRGGRIGGAQAFLGTLLNLKPALTLKEGRVEAAGRARGEKKAREEILKAFRAWAEGRKRIRAYFLYSGDEDAVAALRQEVLASGLPVEEALVNELGAVIASHTGPGTYGFYAYSL